MTRADEQPLPVLDVRTYNLEPGAGEEFDRLVREHSLPMLHRLGIDAARRDAQLGSFYSSDEWRQNYRDTALALVDAYHIAVLPFAPLTGTTARGLT
jgi:hypothetical protein